MTIGRLRLLWRWQALQNKRRSARRRSRSLVQLEALEDRLLPSLTPQLLRDVNAKIASSNPSHLTAVGATIFFTANDGVKGVELWKSDGTVSGTGLVKDIRPGSTGSYPEQL